MTDRRRPVGAERTRTLDESFSLLSKCRRRLAWYHLADVGSASADAVARRVAEWEGVVAEGGRPDPQQVATSLRHAHLPKLAAAGVVSFDPGAETACYVGRRDVDRWCGRARAAEMTGAFS